MGWTKRVPWWLSAWLLGAWLWAVGLLLVLGPVLPVPPRWLVQEFGRGLVYFIWVVWGV